MDTHNAITISIVLLVVNRSNNLRGNGGAAGIMTTRHRLPAKLFGNFESNESSITAKKRITLTY